jgi:tRNA threonylcarbamoyladenosine biosynthesis protein TsaB
MEHRVNILAIETATTACAIGLATLSGVELGWVVDDHRHHTEALTVAIDRVLREFALTPADLDRVVVDRGPGLFTGLRVGLATAIGLSDALGIGLVGVTSLELLAHGAWREGVRGTVVAVVDGRRGEVFVQEFVLDDAVSAVDDPAVMTPRALSLTWASRGVAVTFTGDGVSRYRDELAAVPLATLDDQTLPSTTAALQLALTRTPVAFVEPLYLREADAVANFSTRERS